jgi:hypothetical protein
VKPATYDRITREKFVRKVERDKLAEQHGATSTVKVDAVSPRQWRLSYSYLPTQYITNKLNPSSRIPSKGDLHILWNPKVHYCVDNSLPLFPNLSQLHQVHKLSCHYFKIRLNMILLCTPGYSKRSYSFRCSNQNPWCTAVLSHVWHVLHPSYLP